MLEFFAGPITITNEDLFTPGGILLIIGVLGYFGFWIFIAIFGYKLLRRFQKGDKQTKKQIGIAVIIAFVWFAVLPASSWLIDKVNREKYTREYEECVEKYPIPNKPFRKLTEEEQIAYQSSEYYVNCVPIKSKRDNYL